MSLVLILSMASAQAREVDVEADCAPWASEEGPVAPLYTLCALGGSAEDRVRALKEIAGLGEEIGATQSPWDLAELPDRSLENALPPPRFPRIHLDEQTLLGIVSAAPAGRHLSVMKEALRQGYVVPFEDARRHATAMRTAPRPGT